MHLPTSGTVGNVTGTSHGTYQAGTSHPGLSIQEAAVILGVSPNTVRRWCANGKLHSERLPRPQGETIRVYLEGSALGTSHGTSREVPDDMPYGNVPQVPTELQRAGALADYSAQLLAPVVAELAESRRQLVTQAEEVGRLRTELTVARERVHDLEEQVKMLSAPTLQFAESDDTAPTHAAHKSDSAPDEVANRSAHPENAAHSAFYNAQPRPWWRRLLHW